MTDKKHLVWVYGMANKPEPQLWADSALDLNYATNRDKIIWSRLLTDEESATLSLRELEKKYPFLENARDQSY